MHPYISILTIFLAILMAYRNWNINRNTIFLSGFIFVFSLYSLIHYILLINKDVFLLAVFYNNNAPIGFLVGPLLYFYVRGTLYDNKKLTKKDLLHLIPALINSISITPYILTPFSYKLALAERLVKDTMVARTVTVGLYPNIINMIARPTLLCIYTITSYIILFHFFLKNNGNDRIPQKQTRHMLVWLFSFITIIFFAVICFGVLSYLFLREPNPDLGILKTSTPMNIVGFCLLMIPISLLIFPEILYGIPQVQENSKADFLKPEAEKENETRSKDNETKIPEITSKKEENTQSRKTIENQEIEPKFVELSESILLYIKESQIYLNPNFSMEELSRSMNIPKHHLYYCFNSILKIKLTKIRAELRIEYAKKLIEDGLLDSLTLDAIGNKAGFSSRSSFQSTFKDEVGCTPGEYLKVNIK
jgi:AraC-like DNA-binding protein